MAGTKSRWRRVGEAIWRMHEFQYYNMTYYSGISYSIGSALFVIDGAFSWVPIKWPETEFAGESEWAVPLLFFIGALFYQVGAVMAYLEAINNGSFEGAAMKRFLEGNKAEQKALFDEHVKHMFQRIFSIFRSHRKQSVDALSERKISSVDAEAFDPDKQHNYKFPEGKAPPPRRGGMDLGPSEEGEFNEYLTWQWYPTRQMMFRHHLRDISYMACTIQLFGVTLYGVTGVIILPGILENFNTWQTLGGYWVLQIIASMCFLIASIMFTYESQDRWYLPKPVTVGWWVGFWAIVGSVGFLLSAIFGTIDDVADLSWAAYQSPLTSLWGSAAYLFSSLLQWSLANKHKPVLAFPNSPARGGMI